MAFLFPHTFGLQITYGKENFKFSSDMCKVPQLLGDKGTSIFVKLLETFPKNDIHGLQAHPFDLFSMS